MGRSDSFGRKKKNQRAIVGNTEADLNTLYGDVGKEGWGEKARKNARQCAPREEKGEAEDLARMPNRKKRRAL